jgi:ferredoxin
VAAALCWRHRLDRSGRFLAEVDGSERYLITAPRFGGTDARTAGRSNVSEDLMAGVAIITEACIGVKDRACVDVCPVQCIYEYDSEKNVLVSEEKAGSGIVETTHLPNVEAIAVFADTILYVNVDECTSCTACYQPDVCPVGAIYSEEHVPDGSPGAKYNADDPTKGNDHTFFTQLSRDVFAD